MEHDLRHQQCYIPFLSGSLWRLASPGHQVDCTPTSSWYISANVQADALQQEVAKINDVLTRWEISLQHCKWRARGSVPAGLFQGAKKEQQSEANVAFSIPSILIATERAWRCSHLPSLVLVCCAKDIIKYHGPTDYQSCCSCSVQFAERTTGSNLTRKARTTNLLWPSKVSNSPNLQRPLVWLGVLWKVYSFIQISVHDRIRDILEITCEINVWFQVIDTAGLKSHVLTRSRPNYKPLVWRLSRFQFGNSHHPGALLGL